MLPALGGAALGAILAAMVWAPASWMAILVQELSQGRVILSSPQGTFWNGSARLTLSPGPQSPERLALAQPLQWRLGPQFSGSSGWGLRAVLSHASSMPTPVSVSLTVGWSEMRAQVQALGAEQAAAIQVPAAWLAGLGAPWNTLQPRGQLVLLVQTFDWRKPHGQPGVNRIALQLNLMNMASRVSTLPILGHYQATLRSGPPWQIELRSRPGSALLLEGQGQWSPGSRVEFRGQATAAVGREAALSNLLNIIGRREGDRSIISIR